MRTRAYCAHPSIRDNWALRCISKCPDQVVSLKLDPQCLSSPNFVHLTPKSAPACLYNSLIDTHQKNFESVLYKAHSLSEEHSQASALGMAIVGNSSGAWVLEDPSGYSPFLPEPL
ncbi:hypothetical protein TNCV_595311 [Trichonephila clavipes]|nr:hypothetical protein TNCV_595311 [Trichonephila clavipes]